MAPSTGMVHDHSGGTGVNTNGQDHGHRVGEPGQIHACALYLKGENVVPEGHNLGVQAHTIDGSFNT
jgi:hypothetical protein